MYALLPSLLALIACSGPAPQPDVPLAPPPQRREGHPRNAVLIVIDTLRADVVEQVSTPAIHALVQDGARVDRAWGASTWTVPSVVSLFTGMPVRQHGWDLPTGKLGQYPRLPAAPTLASVLQAQGFATTALYANPYLAEELGFDHGFESWRRSVDKAMPQQFAQQVQAEWGDGRRHYAYLHLLGPHSALRPSEEARVRWEVSEEWFAGTRGFGIGAAKRNVPVGARRAYGRAYRAVVEDCDARVGELLAALAPYRHETLVVLTSDHGELLGEHGVVGHGTWVWEGLTHVPLVMDDPYIPGELESLPSTLGISSIPALVTEHLGITHAWPTASDAALPLVSQREGRVAICTDGHTKAVFNDGATEVFDLSTDPSEARPAAESGEVARALASWEEQVPAGTISSDGVSLAPETLEELRALGYLDDVGW